MKGINNFLQWINDNWTSIVVCVGLVLALINKVVQYSKLSKQEKIDTALKIVKEELLKLMSEAEIEWEDYKKSGELKKSQVITEIYKEFPILKEYVDQDKLVEILTKMIDDEKENMDKIINGIGTKKDSDTDSKK